MRILLLILLTALTCEAQLNMKPVLNRQQTAGGASPTYLVKQGFEGTGYDNSETWTENASPNEDYATAPAPLDGSQSWQSAAIGGESYTSFTAQDDVWAYAVCNIQTLADNRDVFQIRDSGGTYVLSLRAHADGHLQILNFATSVHTSAGLVSNGTTFHVWLHYIKGTGANSTGELYVSANDTKPGSPQASMTTGGSTAQAARVAVMGWNDGNYIWDKVRVDDVSIGSAPQ